ncbi:hypothetical protein [Rufibacter sp. LB8]|uniref:hypothetical protein n=1 Tax=Rufibacter sp. LB8 TaxID=2777781 RepID=UPI00178C5D85|nr:hypothetical protein [Rufibacter sp. LB8]
MKRFSVQVFFAAALLLGVGCSVPDMQVSQSMTSGGEALPVVGRSAFRLSLGAEKGFGFGQYQLQEIHRGWTSRADSPPDQIIQVNEAYQKYRFSLLDTASQKTWLVQAAAIQDATKAQAAGWSVELSKQQEFLKVAFTSPESGTWTLALADPGHYLQRKDFVGKFSNGKQEIDVAPVYKFDGKSIPSSEPLGYEFSKEGAVLASVQTVNNGKVWLNKALAPDLQMALASSCAALLLYQKLGETQ